MKEEDDDRREFTPQERAEIRALIISNKRVAWLWTTIGIWLKWIFWIAAGVVSVKLAIGEYIKSVLR